MLNRITDIAERATCIIDKGEIFYRARDYSREDFLKNHIIISLAEIMKEEFSDLKLDTTDIFNESAMNIVFSTSMWE